MTETGGKQFEYCVPDQAASHGNTHLAKLPRRALSFGSGPVEARRVSAPQEPIWCRPCRLAAPILGPTISAASVWYCASEMWGLILYEDKTR
jgi:hypothetical protein